MKTIIAGSRSIDDPKIVMKALDDSGFKITEVISGGARGVDRIGEGLAPIMDVPLKIMYAYWDKEGKSAGIRRNIRMAEYADALVAVWDGKSKGTKHMIEEAKRRGLKVHVHILGLR